MGEKKRPWYAAPLICGLGIALGGFGHSQLFSTAAAHESPRIVTTSIVADPPPSSLTVHEPGSLSLDERLSKIETTLETLKTQVTELRTAAKKQPHGD